MLESLRNYLGATLPWDVGASQYFRLFGTIFVLIFVGSVFVHVLLQDAVHPLQMLFHAAAVGLAYTVAVGLACAAVHTLRSAVRRLLVWHIWTASFVAFVAGYYLLPLDGLAVWIPVDSGSAHTDKISFFQLLPIWGLVTYFFVQPYLTESLRSELVQLRDVNALLEAGGLSVDGTADPIRFQSGKMDFVLDASSVRNVVVDDHYCYVHYRHNDTYAKRDLAMPLRDVSALLPSDFVQVHRSHIVNLKQIRSVKRRNRSIRLVLAGDFEVPVSRHRLDQILPLLRRQLVV
jgi:hypothetical protein